MDQTLNQVLTLLVAFIASIINYTSMRRNKHIHLAKERLDAVISPLFEKLEPCMKAEQSTENHSNTIEEVCSIIQKNTFLSGGELRRYLLLYERGKFGPAELPGLCQIVSGEYDRLSKSLDIPLRSEKYRKENYASSYHAQYSSDGDIILTATSLFFTGFLILQIILRTITPYGENAPHEFFMVDHTVMFATSIITAFLAILVKIRAKVRNGV